MPQRLMRNRWMWALLGFLAAFLLLFFGRSLWLPLLGRWLVVADPIYAADAIVPLAGEAERVRYAASLFNEGYGQLFLTTNPPSDTPGISEKNYGQLVRREAELNGVPSDRIYDIPQRVHSTKEEALAIRTTAEAEGWDSLLVVTSPYHTRRTRQIFRQVLEGSAIELSVLPVVPHWYDAAAWWRNSYGLQVTVLEYLKFLAHWSGYH